MFRKRSWKQQEQRESSTIINTTTSSSSSSTISSPSLAMSAINPVAAVVTNINTNKCLLLTKLPDNIMLLVCHY